MEFTVSSVFRDVAADASKPIAVGSKPLADPTGGPADSEP
jgi:hypothetical protein